MDTYSAVVFVTCMADVLMFILASGNTGIEKKEKHAIQTVFVMLLAAAALEWSGVALDGTDVKLIPVHALLKCAELCLAPIIVTRWILLFAQWPHTKKILWTICGLNVVFEGISLFTPFVFTIGADNVYRHTDFYFLYILVHGCTIVFFAVECLLFSKSFQNRGRRQILAIVVFELCGLSLHIIWSPLRMDWLCTSMAFTFFYIYYNNLLEQVDSLTHLLTRRSYEAMVPTLRRGAMVVCFDVDDFKTVNDRYGHAMGDACLSTVAGVILDVYGKHGCCYRSGGDEFCCVITRRAPDMEALGRRFDAAMRDVRANETRFELPFVSVGYAVHTPGSNTFEEAVKSADGMMYALKQEGKRSRGEKP